MNTIIYGGAFDPPQLAHQSLIEQLSRSFNPEKIILVPSGPRYDKVYKVSDEHRRRILHIFTENLREQMGNIELCEDFMLGLIPSTTTLGMDTFFQKKLGYSPTQVFGTDVIPDMSKWDPTGRVERELSKIFVTRHGFDPDIRRLDNYVLFSPVFPRNIAALSSTMVRENIKNRIYTGLIPELAYYIQKHNLYQ